jgi:hypothetical protein
VLAAKFDDAGSNLFVISKIFPSNTCQPILAEVENERVQAVLLIPRKLKNRLKQSIVARPSDWSIPRELPSVFSSMPDGKDKASINKLPDTRPYSTVIINPLTASVAEAGGD